MRIKLLVIGKTDDKNLGQLIEKYQQRLNHYINFEIEIILFLHNPHLAINQIVSPTLILLPVAQQVVSFLATNFLAFCN